MILKPFLTLTKLPSFFLLCLLNGLLTSVTAQSNSGSLCALGCSRHHLTGSPHIILTHDILSWPWPKILLFSFYISKASGARKCLIILCWKTEAEWRFVWIQSCFLLRLHGIVSLSTREMWTFFQDGYSVIYFCVFTAFNRAILGAQEMSLASWKMLLKHMAPRKALSSDDTCI